jgi:hypothetical protein
MAFHVARLKAGHTPRTKERPLATGAAGRRGDPLVVDSNGAYATAGANPAAIAAFAASDYGPDTSGFNHLGQKGFPPGYLQGHSVDGEQPFLAHYMGTLPAATGGTYGITLDSDGEWKVDFTKNAANQRVKLVSLDPTIAPLNRNQVEVVVLLANVQVNQ